MKISIDTTGPVGGSFTLHYGKAFVEIPYNTPNKEAEEAACSLFERDEEIQLCGRLVRRHGAELLDD